jgi:type II secretory pathway pseudopilin PulG
MNQEAVNNLPFEAENQAVNQKCYSIIELSIALAIISIILVTALVGVQRILRSNNVNEDLRNLNLLASKITVMLTNVQNTAGGCLATRPTGSTRHTRSAWHTRSSRPARPPRPAWPAWPARPAGPPGQPQRARNATCAGQLCSATGKVVY